MCFANTNDVLYNDNIENKFMAKINFNHIKY